MSIFSVESSVDYSDLRNNDRWLSLLPDPEGFFQNTYFPDWVNTAFCIFCCRHAALWERYELESSWWGSLQCGVQLRWKHCLQHRWRWKGVYVCVHFVKNSSRWQDADSAFELCVCVCCVFSSSSGTSIGVGWSSQSRFYLRTPPGPSSCQGTVDTNR